MISVQVSQVHGDAIRSGRTPLIIWELEVEDRSWSAALTFLGVWAEGFEAVRRCESDVKERVRGLEPAPAVLISVTWVPSSESRVKSMTLLSTLSFAALLASL